MKFIRILFFLMPVYAQAWWDDLQPLPRSMSLEEIGNVERGKKLLLVPWGLVLQHQKNLDDLQSNPIFVSKMQALEDRREAALAQGVSPEVLAALENEAALLVAEFSPPVMEFTKIIPQAGWGEIAGNDLLPVMKAYVEKIQQNPAPFSHTQNQTIAQELQQTLWYDHWNVHLESYKKEEQKDEKEDEDGVCQGLCYALAYALCASSSRLNPIVGRQGKKEDFVLSLEDFFKAQHPQFLLVYN